MTSLAAAFLLLAAGATALAQSSNPELPTAVLSNEINGKIRALDVGDPRSTRHYYAFEATPGDLLLTVNSRNLNGDVDIFTAVTLRPLTKISIYANTIPPEVNKSLYFRTRQILILRVEARTPNDDPGTYRISFGGTFQAFSGGIPVAEPAEEVAETSDDRSGRRLSSAGATVSEPEVKTEEKPPEVAVEKPPAEKPAPRPTISNRRTRPARGGMARRPPAKPAKSEPLRTKTTETPTEEKRAAEDEKPEEKPPAEKPATQDTVGAHLIIEKQDGTRVDRAMSTVRRVIVEGNVIVIVMKSGRTDRIPMSLVVRMAIEP